MFETATEKLEMAGKPTSGAQGRRARRTVAAVIGACIVATTLAQDLSKPIIVPFSRMTTLDQGWAPLTFKKIDKHTRYRLVDDSERGKVIEATAQASSSGLIFKLDADARATPKLRFSWKIGNAIGASDVRSKDGDDYPARVYVTFTYTPDLMSPLDRVEYSVAKSITGEFPPHAALTYIYQPKERLGERFDNPFTKRVKMIVVDGGAPGTWRSFERDLAADYQAAFGSAMPRVSGIAIMTDTDNTGENAVAWFGDIALSAK